MMNKQQNHLILYVDPLKKKVNFFLLNLKNLAVIIQYGILDLHSLQLSENSSVFASQYGQAKYFSSIVSRSAFLNKK